MFKVSVIIPVYNAEKYVEEAVQSAVVLEEVGEVILVEDRSPDNCLEICKRLSEEYPKVKLAVHPGNQNMGAGASRNLGIGIAEFDYISFLDADDYYLPNRFIESKKIFSENQDVDFVFEASQYDFNHAAGNKQIKTMKPEYFAQATLFSLLLSGKAGYFDTNSITIRKDRLAKVGLFNTALRLHQDSELWLRMAYYLTGVAGNLSGPVSIVRVHEHNRIANLNDKSKFDFWQTVYSTFREEDLLDTDGTRIRLYYNYFRQSLHNGPLINKLNRIILRLRLGLLK